MKHKYNIQQEIPIFVWGIKVRTELTALILLIMTWLTTIEEVV